MNSAKAKPSVIVFSEFMTMEGDARSVLPGLPDNFFQCVVTSPPYWGLRDYGIDGQIGLESTLTEYIANLIFTFREVRRVLKPDGIFWLNIGDGYTSGNRGWRAPDKKNPHRAMSVRPDNPPGLKDKDLLGVPWRLALALQADQWYLRSDIIWHKPNAMPESVKDRPTRAHEYLFMFTKTERYTYFNEAVMEKTSSGSRNRRSVWSVNTAPSMGSHMASFPPELVEPCLLASTQPGDFVLDPFCGIGTVGVVSKRLQRRFMGIELNPNYMRVADKLLSAKANGPAQPNHTIYQSSQNEHEPSLHETSGKHCVRARNDPKSLPARGPRRSGARAGLARHQRRAG